MQNESIVKIDKSELNNEINFEDIEELRYTNYYLYLLICTRVQYKAAQANNKMIIKNLFT